jgi:transposase
MKRGRILGEEQQQAIIEHWRHGWKYSLIAEAVQCSPNTVGDIVRRHLRGEGLRLVKSRASHVKLSDDTLQLIDALVEDAPMAVLAEYVAMFHGATGLELSRSTMHRALHRRGWAHRKNQPEAAQANQKLRLAFALRQSMYKAEQLVVIDETGFDMRNAARTHGWARRGSALKHRGIFHRGKRVSASGAIHVGGVLDWYLVSGGFNGQNYLDFARVALVPHLQAFPGPRSVVVLDNLAIHQSVEFRRLVEERGARLLFLPPYSPDFSPIENVFGEVKSKLHMLGSANPRTDLWTLIARAFLSVKPASCAAAFHRCGWQD